MKAPIPRPNAKQAIIKSAFQLFHKEGFGRVSVDAIAANAKVTKRTVYYHFTSKDEILTEVLNNQHITDLSNFQNWVGEQQLTSVKFVETLFDQLSAWASKPDWVGSGFTRVALELAHLRGHPARKSTSQYKTAIENWIASQFKGQDIAHVEADELAQQIMVLIEGSMCLTLIHDDISYMQSAALAAKKLTDKYKLYSKQ